MKKLFAAPAVPCLLLAVSLLFSEGCAGPPEVTVHYLGHSSFVLQFGDDLTVLTDYGESNALGLASPIHGIGELVPDIVTISHDHADHFGGELPPGIKAMLTGNEILRSRGLTITPIPTFERSLLSPDNFSFLFEYKGLKVLHLGDCQSMILGFSKGMLGPDGNFLSGEQLAALIKKTYPDTYDLVLLPIGFTQEIIPEAAEFAGNIDARAIVPMHYWTLEERDAFVARMGDRKDGRGRPYNSRVSTDPFFTITLSSEPVTEVELLALTPAPR
jgi:L-ascorbate metabolism protein UlaG (beta-lactamase superfamily)